MWLKFAVYVSHDPASFSEQLAQLHLDHKYDVSWICDLWKTENVQHMEIVMGVLFGAEHISFRCGNSHAAGSFQGCHDTARLHCRNNVALANLMLS